MQTALNPQETPLESTKTPTKRRIRCKTKHLVFKHGRWVEGFEGDYSITDKGEVWTFKHALAHRLNTRTSKDGFLRVSFSQDRVVTSPTVHHLVMAAWGQHLPKPEGKGKLIIIHKNRDKTDNRLDNLMWWRGAPPNSKTNEGEFREHKYSQYQAQEAWNMMVSRKYTRQEIMEALNVPYHFLANVAAGHRWKCIDRGGLTKLPKAPRKRRKRKNEG
jgi:hypothetical protein